MPPPDASRELREAVPHVMHIALSLDPGGTERLIVELSKRATGRFRVTVCCLDRPGAWAPELQALGIEVFGLDRKPGFHPSLGLRIARETRRRHVDVLHCHHYTPFVYGCLARLIAPRVPLVFTEHGRLSDAPPTPKRRLITPWLAYLASEMYAVSGDLRRYLAAAGFPGERLGVITNGINIGTAPGAAARDRAKRLLETAGGNGRTIVAAIGRLDEVKDLTVLLDAFSSLERRDTRLLIIGDGPDAGRLRAHAAGLHLGSRLEFLGYRADVVDLLPGIDVLVNTSIIEGISLTILEAMAACVPVIATAVGGTPEVVVDGVTGLLVASRSPTAVAAALEPLLQSPDRREQMGRAGRARVEALFTFQGMAERYFAVYDRLVRRSRRPAPRAAGGSD